MGMKTPPELMRKFGEFVHSLSGRYTAEDVGMETKDMDIVRDVTPYISKERGAGNPSPVTAYSVYGDELQNINLVLIHLRKEY
jgi:leucine dehydrogenase